MVRPHLRDAGLVQQGLDVFRDQVGTSGRQCGGHDEDDQRPPPGPVDHRSVVVARHCRHSETESRRSLTVMLRSNQVTLQCRTYVLLALSFGDMNVIDMGVCLQGEYQTDDVGDWQEGRHGVHQRPETVRTHTAEREELRVRLESSGDVTRFRSIGLPGTSKQTIICIRITTYVEKDILLNVVMEQSGILLWAKK